MSVEPVETEAPDTDGFAAEVALRAPEPLRGFNQFGVLSAADVHVALALGRLAEVPDDANGRTVLLATALAVRAPRLGHVFADLATISRTAAVENEQVPVSELPWPEVDSWLAALSRFERLVAVGDDGAGPPRPLRLDGSRLYLDRYWREERQLAEILAAFGAAPLRQVELSELAESVQRLFPGADDLLQRAAATCGVLRGLTVIAGGPGTGKTTTVARISALLGEGAASRGSPPPLIALCAPTGKAAARLQEAVHREAETLAVGAAVREQLLGLRASTIHRLLGWRPGGRFRHNAGNRLPHDVVIVDETSMVPLSLMVALLEAVRSDAQVVLVGDPDQLAAIEAGAVLRDIVGPADAGLRFGPGMRALVARVTGAEPPGDADARAFGDGVVVLRRGHRFGEAIEDLADAVRLGDGDATVAALRAAPDQIVWIDADDEAALRPLRGAAVESYSGVVGAAQSGDGRGALQALGAFRLLCAHRHGPYGVAGWGGRIERWLADAIESFEPSERDYVGRPLLVTQNDYELRLHNGDTGVVVSAGPDGTIAVFERDGGELAALAPSRLGAVETLFATTVHKAQGSQFAVTAVVLPEPSSRILTRELLYTAVTRARQRLILVGSEDAIRAAVSRPAARASGLRELLWDS